MIIHYENSDAKNIQIFSMNHYNTLLDKFTYSIEVHRKAFQSEATRDEHR